MERLFAILASAMGFLGVALGAFGAHGLRAKFAERPDLGAVYHTAVEYHLVHAVALLGAAWVVSRSPSAFASAAGWCFLGGTLVFSGSLYLLAFTSARWLGAITPIGGALFLIGWLLLGIAASRI